MKLSEDVQAEVDTLHKDIQSALSRFTKATGLFAAEIGWDIITLRNDTGSVIDYHYNMYRTSLDAIR